MLDFEDNTIKECKMLSIFAYSLYVNILNTVV